MNNTAGQSSMQNRSRDDGDLSTSLPDLNEMMENSRKLMETLREIKVFTMEELLEWCLICDPSLRLKFAETAEKAKIKCDQIQEAMKQELSIIPPCIDQGHVESSDKMETNQ